MWSTMSRNNFVVFFCIFCAVIEKAISSEPSNNDIRVLIYETEAELSEHHHATILLHQLEQLHGVQGSIFGQGDSFEGFGQKFRKLIPILETLPHDDLVVVSDSRDVLINNPKHSNVYVDSVALEFRANFEKLTNHYPGAIVVSAEAQCCVAALTHIEPGSYFNTDGSRSATACTSGEPGCLWNGDEKALPWENFMKDLSIQRTGGQPVDDMYLNAGLITGQAGDLLRVLNALQLGVEEDDQAVLTDFMYHNSGSIVLDYGQALFGNNRGGLGGVDDGGCVFVQPKLSPIGHSRLVHIHTLTTPLFVHSPGGFFECHETLAADLGHNMTEATSTHRRLNFFLTLLQKRKEENKGKGKGPPVTAGPPPIAAPVVPIIIVPEPVNQTAPVNQTNTTVVTIPPLVGYNYRALSTTRGDGSHSILLERRKKIGETRARLRRTLYGDDK